MEKINAMWWFNNINDSVRSIIKVSYFFQQFHCILKIWRKILVRHKSPLKCFEVLYDNDLNTKIESVSLWHHTFIYFQKSTIPTYERMWAFMSSTDPWVFVKDTDTGVKMVREKNGKYAFLTESTQNEYTNQRKPCDTMKVGGNLDAKGYGIGTPMGSDLRSVFNVTIIEFVEWQPLFGSLEYVFSVWLGCVCICNDCVALYVEWELRNQGPTWHIGYVCNIGQWSSDDFRFIGKGISHPLDRYFSSRFDV